MKKYTYNEEFFKTPTEENCYVAGLIASDGCLYKDNSCKNYIFKLAFKESDKYLLEEFRLSVKYDGNIGYYKQNTCPMSQIRISGIQNNWLLDLNQHWNITPRKSLTLKPPNITDINLCLAYIIGYIDGDGSICIFNIKQQNKKIISLSIEGTFEVLNWISQILSNLEDKKYKLLIPYKRKDRNTYELSYNKQRAYKLLHHLNKIQVPFKLKRKWNKIEEYEQFLCQNN